MPWVSDGFVLAGEIITRFWLLRMGATFSATLELSVPMTATTALSSDSFVAALAPTSGTAVSSWASRTTFQPLILFCSLACLTARSAPFLMPRPRAVSEPDSGAITPILTVLVEPESAPSCVSDLSLPQAERMTVATRMAIPILRPRSIEGLPSVVNW